MGSPTAAGSPILPCSITKPPTAACGGYHAQGPIRQLRSGHHAAGQSSLTYRQSGTFDNPGVPTDWLEFTFFNTVSDQGTPATLATDFYIRRLEITGAATGKPGDFDSDGDVDAARTSLAGVARRSPNAARGPRPVAARTSAPPPRLPRARRLPEPPRSLAVIGLIERSAAAS